MKKRPKANGGGVFAEAPVMELFADSLNHEFNKADARTEICFGWRANGATYLTSLSYRPLTSSHPNQLLDGVMEFTPADGSKTFSTM